jgi:hypothetical protein
VEVPKRPGLPHVAHRLPQLDYMPERGLKFEVGSLLSRR